MRKTKIICTIGPVTSSYEMLEKLYNTGMDVVRLNMSHGDHESHAQVIKAIHALNQKIPYPIPMLLDTQGPEIRTGLLANDLKLQEGSEITIVVRGSDDVEESSIQINYDDLINAVAVGDMITVDNGLINLRVLNKNERTMQCQVIDGGTIGSKRHVNLPGVRINLPAITEKDRKDILFGVEQGVDFIALSFVRNASDVRELRELLGSNADKIKIISKIEDQEGVKNIEDIIRESDGIMVARGDLGVEINFYELPGVQRRIVRLCAKYGKRVIIATHLLESMINNPMPTRAEVTDVANAVYEEADAVMLSGETTVGKYPLKCVECLDKITRHVEQQRGLRFTDDLILNNNKQNIAASAVHLAETSDAKGILVITRSGRMANFVTNCHPQKSAIFAFTNDERTRRQLALNRNVRSYLMDFNQDPERTFAIAYQILMEKEQLQIGDKVVVISDILEGAGIAAIQIREIYAPRS